MTGTSELSRRLVTRTDDAGPVAPILISVPTIRFATSRPSTARIVPRRRLRREVRLAGMALLLATTLSLGYWAGTRSSNGAMTAAKAPGATSESSARHAAVSSASLGAIEAIDAITLAIEPIAVIASRPEPEQDFASPRAVELESTLLPVDGSEDPPHEGR